MNPSRFPPNKGAIITKYRGVDFCSRIEATYAKFFDELGLQWAHERQGYEGVIDGKKTRMLPDFWLPDLQCFIEIKPRDDYDRDKPRMVTNVTDVPVYVAFDFPNRLASDGETRSMHYYLNGEYKDDQFEITRCPRCEQWKVLFRAWSSRCDCKIDRNFSDPRVRDVILRKEAESKAKVRQAAERAMAFAFWREVR